MRKNLLITMLCISAVTFAYSQPQCLKDVWYTLTNEQYIKAKKIMDQCIVGNETSADAWLAKGNVYLQLYNYEQNRLKESADYTIRFPNALLEAYDAFNKALEINKDVTPSGGMADPKEGQLLCAYPIQELGLSAMKQKDWNKAIEYILKAIKAYKINAKENVLYIAYAYLDISDCYYAMNEPQKQKEALQSAAKLKPAEPIIYLSLYDIYKAEKDTVSCESILKIALSVIPDSLALDIKGAQLDLLAMTGKTDQLKKNANEIYNQFKDSLKIANLVINTVGLHLVNNGFYEDAQPMIEYGLSLDSTNFDLIQLMAFRYYYAIEQCQKDIEAMRTSSDPDKYTKIQNIQITEKSYMENAHVWLEKGYNINQNDRAQNIMLRRVKLLLRLPVPEDLKAKCDSYNKPQ